MKKRMYIWLAALLVSALLVSGAGAWLKYELFEELGIETRENIISLPFVLMTDPQLRYTVESRTEQLRNPGPSTEPTQTLPAETVPTTVPETNATIPPETTVPPTTVPDDGPVDESWFDDVLFIGESRTMGLQSMGRLGKADYFCIQSLTVYGVLGIETSDVNFPRQSLESLLSSRTYGKIYIHLGINELGGNLDDFTAQYQHLIDVIREMQPDAYIILQAAMAVTSDYSSRPAFRIESIRDLNDRIASLAEGEMLRFSDVNTMVCGEDGYLKKELTNDGCHLTGPGYELWKQWLMEDAGTLNIPEME